MNEKSKEVRNMLEDVYENEVGYMVGTFYADIFGYELEAWFKKDISVEYVEKNIKYLNNLDREFLVEICNALRRYYEDYLEILPDICEDMNPDIIKDFEKDPASILSYIELGICEFDDYDIADENIPVIKLGGDCAWSGDEGIRIVARNNQLLYVGPWEDFNVWRCDRESILGQRFNYAVPKEQKD
ncbi:MAG: hypothetical protein NC251_10225 [Lachnoclostridium sp.]|nr:hypothetical protein [Lachnospira sp.]MCM1248793.1 hypothetical protein [Lachnoclostridium sp.]